MAELKKRPEFQPPALLMYNRLMEPNPIFNNIYLFNTLTKEKEVFNPLKKGHVSMYHCGPTVYNFQHIGNLRAYITADILRRVFEFNDYSVTQVMNITDIGHLQSDQDDGDDKMTLAIRRENLPFTLESIENQSDLRGFPRSIKSIDDNQFSFGHIF